MRVVMLAMALTGCEALTGATTESTEAEGAAVQAEPVQAEVPTPADAAEAPEDAAPLIRKLNLNDATENQLEGIPGITPKLVHEFEEYRPYVSMAQFRKEIGKYVDESTVRMFETYVYVPVDPMASDATTIQQLGLTEEQAQALVDGRPYADRAAFLAALGAHLSGDELDVAKDMLKPE